MIITPFSLSEGLFACFGLTILLLKIRDEHASRVQKTWTDSAYFIVLIVSFGLVFADLGRVAGLGYPILPKIGYYGTAITTLGLSFATWGRIALGRFWTGPVCIVENHRLKTDGPYRITRHPMYTGIFVGIVGAALTQGQVRSVLAVLLMVVALVYRIIHEELMLLGHFGGEYKRYQGETPGLIPGAKAITALFGKKHASS